MDLTEKIAYIKGLAEGLALDENKAEVKVINAVIDLLDDIAYDLTDMEDLYDEKDPSDTVDIIWCTFYGILTIVNFWLSYRLFCRNQVIGRFVNL